MSRAVLHVASPVASHSCTLIYNSTNSWYGNYKKYKAYIMGYCVMLFVSSLYLDVSKFGGWAHIDISMIFFTFGLIFLGGLFLASFMFRRKKYKERVLLTTPIAVILFSLFIFSNIVIYEYGLFDEYNYFSAKRDIKHGKIQLVMMVMNDIMQ
jgi:hypothetical protein